MDGDGVEGVVEPELEHEEVGEHEGHAGDHADDEGGPGQVHVAAGALADLEWRGKICER